MSGGLLLECASHLRDRASQWTRQTGDRRDIRWQAGLAGPCGDEVLREDRQSVAASRIRSRARPVGCVERAGRGEGRRFFAERRPWRRLYTRWVCDVSASHVLQRGQRRQMEVKRKGSWYTRIWSTVDFAWLRDANLLAIETMLGKKRKQSTARF